MMVRHDLVAAAFIRLSMHAKLHKHLDNLEDRRERDVVRVETDEIHAYADDLEYSELEEMKKRMLAISFLKK